MQSFSIRRVLIWLPLVAVGLGMNLGDRALADPTEKRLRRLEQRELERDKQDRKRDLERERDLLRKTDGVDKGALKRESERRKIELSIEKDRLQQTRLEQKRRKIESELDREQARQDREWLRRYGRQARN